MQRMQRSLGEERFHDHIKNPSFSTSLLDRIYRSIDEGDKRSGELKFYRDTGGKKQNKISVECNRVTKEEEEIGTSSFRQECLLDQWMEKKANEKLAGKQRHHFTGFERKSQHCHQLLDRDQEIQFFSSTSSSSDSSSGGLSSSDTESMYRMKSPTTSCFAPLRPKPVRAGVPARRQRSEKVEKRQSNLYYEQRELHLFDDYHHHSVSDHISKHDESLSKSKSRALKIYNNLKKVKQPISPGGRLASFINSLFTTGNTKKAKTTSFVGGCEGANAGRKINSSQDSTCSSASSFSRSCLSKHSPATREKLRNGVKRTVRFYPISVIMDEDSRPRGHKCLYEEDEDPNLLSVSVPTAWKIGRSPSGKKEDDLKSHVVEKSRRVEAAAKEFLKGYHQTQKKNDLVLRNLLSNTKLGHGKNDVDDYEYEDEDDAASCSSSDLFELDHLSVMGNHRYCEELPVYETTHVSKNRAIANGLIV